MFVGNLLLLILITSSTDAFRPHRPPIQHLFATTRRKPSNKALKPGIDATELRKALSSAGSDVSPKMNQQLVESYGDENKRIRLKEFDRLVRKHKHLTGARLWLTLDPHDSGIRSSRLGFAKFGKSGMKTWAKLLHYAFGTVSLCIGTTNMISFIVAATSNNVHSIPFDESIVFATIHTIAAIFSLPRFEYDFEKQEIWKLGLKTSREANMWPSFIICIWYTLALSSDLVWPSSSALFSFNDPIFLLFSAITSFFIFYGLGRGILEDIERQDGEWNSSLASFYTMLPVITDSGRVLFFGSSEAGHAAYLHLLDVCPEFRMLQVSLILGAMYAGNLLCALASAQLHKACTDEHIEQVSLWLNLVYGLLPLVFVFLMSDGTFVPEYMNVIQIAFEA